MSIYSLAECGHIVEIGAQCQTCLDQVPFQKAKETTHSIWMRKQEFDALKEQVAQLTAERDQAVAFWEGEKSLMRSYVQVCEERDRLAERAGKLREALEAINGPHQSQHGEDYTDLEFDLVTIAAKALADDDKLSKVD